MNFTDLKSEIFHVKESYFDELSLKIFRFQYENNHLYHQFVDNLRVNPKLVKSVEEIPFLPIEIFKYQKIYTGTEEPKNYFESSGTTGQITSKHYYLTKDFYFQVAERIFETHYGPLENYHIIGLLPSYLERENASLVAMVNDFIKKSQSEFSGFYLNNFQELNSILKKLVLSNKKTLILGVSFGILDWLESGPLPEEIIQSFKNEDFILMETGGMKGRRKELSREELHQIFQKFTQAPKIHSEYGMTELFSQSYSQGEGIFKPGFTQKILIRELNDPFSYVKTFSKIGGINLIDLANIESLCFIATQDAGKKITSKEFLITGRIKEADLRGCNLMIN